MKRRRMHSVKAAIVLPAVLLLAGCGGSSVKVVDQPPGSPPTHARSAPPPAWAETEHDSHWLAYSNYCWSASGSAQCGDFVAPSCADRRIPKMALQQGETIRFHLGFDPTKVSVTEGGSSETLPPGRDPIVRARGTNGAMTLFVHAPGGSATYAACLQFMRQSNNLNIHPSQQ